MLLRELQSPNELVELERHLDRLMAPVGLDVVFTQHFKERILGRDQSVTIPEVVDAFTKLKAKYKRKLKSAKRQGGYHALLKDFDHDLNVAFRIEPPPSGKGMAKLANITIMRKDPARFGTDSTPNQEVLAV